jgi:hypothetical protein
MKALRPGTIRSGCVTSATPGWNARWRDCDGPPSPPSERCNDISAVERHWQHRVKVYIGGVKEALTARVEAPARVYYDSMTDQKTRRSLGSGEMPMISTGPLRWVQSGVQPSVVVSDLSNTLADLRHTLDVGAWPTRGLAVRAAASASDPARYAPLLRCAEGHYIRAARLWLQIASYVESDDEEFIAALRLSLCCARIGGNIGFTRNCMARLAAAERQRGHSRIDVRAVAS